MKLKSLLLKDGNLQSSTGVAELTGITAQRTTEIWYDIQDTEIDELQRFLSVLDLHPLMLDRCLDKSSTPGVISFGGTVMLEYPVSSNFDEFEQSYISIILQHPILITIRHNACPVLDDFIQEYVSRSETGIVHLVQLLYLIIDEITDLSVQAETELRDKIIEMSRKLTDNPTAVKEKELNDLRWEVEKLISLNENQLYCVHSLSALDNPALNEPHRKAYIQDLASEVEIVRNGIYRLETRIKDLSDSFQLEASARVEKRLRILTIVSAITLPFGLIAGLLGMNVGGLPGTNEPLGFVFVISLMLVISIVELWYFKRKGWFK